MQAGAIPIVILVREGTIVPHIALAQSTDFMDWSSIELKVYPDQHGNAYGLLVFPGEEVQGIEVESVKGKARVKHNPFGQKVELKIIEN